MIYLCGQLSRTWFYVELFSLRFMMFNLSGEGKDETSNQKVESFLDSWFFKDFAEFSALHNDATPLENFFSFVKNIVDEKTNGKQLPLFNTGIKFLKLFIQKNWTDPDIAPLEKLSTVFKFSDRSDVIKELVVDGENVVSAVEHPEFLLCSKIIIETFANQQTGSELIRFWHLNCLFVHQQILEELSPNLFEKICGVIDQMRKFSGAYRKRDLITNHLNFARIFLYYDHIEKAKFDIEEAKKLSNIQISLSGALGKRTKFQSRDVPQLILKINFKNDEYDSDDEFSLSKFKRCEALPKDVKLDDEVRLNEIKYADDTYNLYLANLDELQEAIILANLFLIQKSQPKDSLADEELQPLINFILRKPLIWSLQMTTLLLRSKLEANHKRTVERAMMQVQVLVDSLKDEKSTIEDGIPYFFLSYLPPKWVFQSTLANLMVSVGSVKSALEIYQSLEEWENVIYCYNTLQLRHKAQEVIEQELKKNPSPKLWCLLGDATDDLSCYEKAWELSNRRSARAQRHWALFYYYRKNYLRSIEHFQKSLEINSLQKDLWYRLGYAALVEEQWEVSAQAYRRYCVLDPECFEAWNNLGRCYCELKQKYRAWKALQEALKVDYSNWKVWDNYMVVSSDLQEFDEVIKSYHEILNLKEKHLDLPILNSLVAGFKNLSVNKDDSGQPENRKRLGKSLLELFGRLTSQIINESELWLLYSEVIDTDSPENLSKKHQLLLKAHRSAINKADWDKNLETCNRVVYVLSKLTEVGLLIQKPDVLMSSKLAATGPLAKIKKEYPEVDISETLEKNLEKLEAALSDGSD